MNRVLAGVVEEVMVTHGDRFCRVAIQLVECSFARAGCRLVGSSDFNISDSSSTELAKPTTSPGPRTDKPPATKVHKIRMFPTPKEAETLRRWFGTAR